ncbi:MAG: hypothetical protein ABJF86_13030 [Tateyamaria sp.]|uniref:hypothetical protein n=1 Tax=Tateyamaria sp. TaxID=1929288 RepID=UPI00328CE497
MLQMHNSWFGNAAMQHLHGLRVENVGIVLMSSSRFPDAVQTPCAPVKICQILRHLSGETRHVDN